MYQAGVTGEGAATATNASRSPGTTVAKEPLDKRRDIGFVLECGLQPDMLLHLKLKTAKRSLSGPPIRVIFTRL